MNAQEALRHWGSYGRSEFSKVNTCFSIEKNFVKYRHLEKDKYNPRRDPLPLEPEPEPFKYDVKVAEKVDKIITSLHVMERNALKAKHIYGVGMTLSMIADYLGIARRDFERYYDNGFVKFSRAWKNG